jgi:hypothetical protein
MASSFQNTKTALITAILSLLLSICSAASVQAEGEGSLSVSPLFTDITLSPSETAQDFFLTVSNTTAEPVVLRLSLVDFGSLNESGGVAFLGKEGNGTSRYALASWITPEKDVVTLLPGAEEKLKFTVENRESLSPGGHYGAALFSIETEGGTAGTHDTNIALNSTFSALIFAKKEGGIIQELTLKEHGTDMYNLISGLPKKAFWRFQNSGNVDLTPRGRITLTDPLGRLVAKGVLNEDSARILPESFRVYHTLLVSVMPSLVPGFYTVSTEYRFDGQDAFQAIPEQRVFAWGIAFWWLAGIVVIFLGIRALRRKSKLAKKL